MKPGHKITAHIRKTDALHLPWYVEYWHEFRCSCKKLWAQKRMVDGFKTHSEALAHAVHMGAKVDDPLAGCMDDAFEEWANRHPSPGWSYNTARAVRLGDVHIPWAAGGAYPPDTHTPTANEQAGDRVRDEIHRCTPEDDYLLERDVYDVLLGYTVDFRGEHWWK